MNKFKTYDFWVKLAAAVVLLLRILGNEFGFSIDGVLFMDIVTAVAGLLVVLGIISAPSSLTKIKKVGDKIMNENDLVCEDNEIICDKMQENNENIDKNIVLDSDFAKNEEEENSLFPKESKECERDCEEISYKEASSEETDKTVEESKTITQSCNEVGDDCESFKDEKLVINNCEGGDVACEKDPYNTLINRIDYLISKFEALLKD